MTRILTPQAGMHPNIWSHSCMHTGPVSVQVDHQPTVLSDGLAYFHHTGPDQLFFFFRANGQTPIIRPPSVGK